MFRHLKLLFVFSTLSILINAVKFKGISEDLEDPHIIKLTKFAEKKLAEHWGSDQKPVVLIKALKQTFNGHKYILNFATLTEDMNEFCDVEVLDENRPMDTQLISLNCKSSLQEIFKENDPIKMFINFMKEYKKVYKNRSEFHKRFLIFNSNLERIKKLNDLASKQPGGAVYGVTKFSDLTKEEFLRLGGNIRFPDPDDKPPIPIPDVDLPEEFDWREKNAVTQVKNQGGCGSCYTFSAVGSVEGQVAIKLGKLIDLSEQQLLDCDTGPNQEGCDGGYMRPSLKYIKDNGIVSDSDYPYTATDGNGCQLTENSTFYRIDDYTPIEKNETKIAQWLFQNGPVSIGIDASLFSIYHGGIIHAPGECQGELNHGVLIVGYGINPSDKLPFWIVKNSWGKGVGIDGYFLLARGFNECGVSEDASTAIIKKH